MSLIEHLDTLALIYVTLMGAVVGSFCNVVIARLPQGQSVVSPRSRCPQCARGIAWYDNIPILSFLLLRASCRHCAQPIPWRYPAVELAMGALAAALWLRWGLSWHLAFWFPMTAALLCITYIDLDHWWIPDRITYPAIAAATIYALVLGGGAVDALWGLCPAAGVWLIGFLFARITGREGMGLGDIKLLVLLGLSLGLMDTITALFLASVQGSVIGVALMFMGGHRGLAERSEDAGEGQPTLFDDGWTPPPRAIPFGPFLVLGAYEVLLLPSLFGRSLTGLSDWIFRSFW